ncbi:hypothetical protein A6770_25460 [Nostoc minutum NIES-26]|uniref:Uncharacterized protein n=1 Tax=Nostoc minutum NIES-26 TaxID=1844469 RepID=A0A367QVM4_9NOSO|nr:hypothetical protein A6770_25460 [Nostoc minutum NIES-26]
MPNFGMVVNALYCKMFTNTPDSIMVVLPDNWLAPGGVFFSSVTAMISTAIACSLTASVGTAIAASLDN